MLGNHSSFRPTKPSQLMHSRAMGQVTALLAFFKTFEVNTHILSKRYSSLNTTPLFCLPSLNKNFSGHRVHAHIFFPDGRSRLSLRSHDGAARWVRVIRQPNIASDPGLAYFQTQTGHHA